MLKKCMLSLLAFVFIFCVAGCGLTDDEKKEEAARLSDIEQETMAPDIVLTASDGRQIHLAQLYMDKPVYLNFWATWCPPSVKQMPNIDNVYKKYGDKIIFAVVDVDSSEADAASFLKRTSFAMTMYKGNFDDAADTYSLYTMPVSMIIAKNGTILDTHVGEMNEQELEKFLGPIL